MPQVRDTDTWQSRRITGPMPTLKHTTVGKRAPALEFRESLKGGNPRVRQPQDARLDALALVTSGDGHVARPQVHRGRRQSLEQAVRKAGRRNDGEPCLRFYWRCLWPYRLVPAPPPASPPGWCRRRPC